MALCETENSSEFNCLESTPAKEHRTAKEANTSGRPVTGQWEKQNQSQRQAFLLQTAPNATPIPCTSHCHQRTVAQWLPPTEHWIAGNKKDWIILSWWRSLCLVTLMDAADGPLQHWQSLNSNANKFLMGISPFLPSWTREQSRVLGIEKLERIRPQLLSVQFVYSFHFTRKPQWCLVTCDPKVKERASAMGSEVWSSLLKPNQGC